jgi:hypothetical protein
MIYTRERLALAALLGSVLTVYFFFWLLAKTDGPETSVNLAWLQQKKPPLNICWWLGHYDLLLLALVMSGTVVMLILRDWNQVLPS